MFATFQADTLFLENQEDQMPRRVSKHDIVTHTVVGGFNPAAPSFGLWSKA
jgi:hypothetical protein